MTMTLSRPVPTALPSGIRPNSRTHWALLLLGAAGSVAFNATYVLDGLARTGYDSLRQPMSALSLGPGGWVQVLNFIAFGVIGCVSAAGWRATLAPGLGATWYPRLRVLAGLAMIAAGVFTQDPGTGYPVGVPTLAQPSTHAVVHQLVSFVSLTTVVVELVILARRFAREPHWRGWATATIVAAVLMMASLATFGTLMAQGGPAGLFEKLASAAPSLLGLAIVVRFAVRRDARLA